VRATWLGQVARRRFRVRFGSGPRGRQNGWCRTLVAVLRPMSTATHVGGNHEAK
jgi:hypothetical protein